MNKERYNRHIILPEIGEEGQQKLEKASVLVVGAGGLGAPILQYLVAAGIGRIGIVDADIVSLSNLQRQILYREQDLGLSKVQQAKATLQGLNAACQIDTYNVLLDEFNAEELIARYDIVVGATDSFASRLLIDKHTKNQRKPFVHGSICAFSGQVSVFNFDGGPSYTDLFPDTPQETMLPLGVMGVLPGIIGSMQACEVLKIILGIGDVLSGKLLLYDALKVKSEVISFGFSV
jgi:molybdopterin/thiamine biosynthesis adenylyltransferase